MNKQELVSLKSDFDSANYDQVINQCERVLTADPNNYAALYFLGHS
jgi:hypothetical protein